MAVHEHGELITSRRGFFWVGVEPGSSPAGTVARGPMYVYWEAPEEVRHPYPIVLIHGGGGQGLDWLGTPDGRPGWASYLVREGYAVYVVDRPGHGRASLHPDVLGPMGPPFTYELARFLFMPPGSEGTAPNPTAELHTQWPGDGEIGDPALDQFLASAGPMLQDFAATHALEGGARRRALGSDRPSDRDHELRRRPRRLGDGRRAARPGQGDRRGRGLTAFFDNPDLGVSLDWGLAACPLTYDPPVSDPAELRSPDSQHKLVNLQGVPIAIVTGEASFMGLGDADTVAFLQRTACDVEHVRLADHGVHGNGHLMMMERNNREALQPILDWLRRHE